jgi:ABC-2 type transport system permease protein
MRFFRLTGSYLRIGVANEFQYRANLFIQILQSVIALAVGLIGLALVYGQTEALGGWTRTELLAVMGIFMLMGGLIQAAIQPNMQRLMGDIQEGTLDYALTKPVDAQALISVREFRLWKLVDVILGLSVLGVAIYQMQSEIGFWQAIAFVLALIMGGVMIYCFWLMLTSTAFWIIRVDEMVNLFEGIYAAGRWPVSVYPDWLRWGLTFLVPVAFAVTVPAEAITGRLTPLTLLGAFGLMLLLMALARFVFRKGVKNYAGASA